MALQMWSAEKSRQLQKRIIVEGDLVLQTPAHFGAGEGDELIDMPLLLDAYDDETPLLTGASIAGALRSYLRSQEAGYNQPLPERNDPEYKNLMAKERRRSTVKLFGGIRTDDEGLQSPLIVEDAYGKLDTAGVELRTGVRLESKTRTASQGALYDARLWQAGTTFPLRFELLVGKKDDAGELCRALATALDGLSNGRITLGARKRRGYGQVKVTTWRVKEYDLTDPVELCDWLKHGNDPLPEILNVADLKTALSVDDLLPDNRQYLRLSATFALQGSLLIRSGEGQDDIGPDMVHLHARQADGQKKPILSGTSLAGVLRARATRIANTLDKAGKAKELIYDIFGPDMNDREWMRAKKEKGVRASRLTVKEKVVENGRTDLVQNRVSIDRFTGGARDTALFNEQPLFAKEETRITVDLHLRNPKEADIGLLLLLLKDLWTEDLPLGGESSVGRGRLQGREAKLVYKNGGVEEWALTAVSLAMPNQLNFIKGNPTRLQEFVDALHKKLGGGQS